MPFSKDQELDELERATIDVEDEFLSLQLMATGKNTLAGYDVDGLTPLSICILWLMNDKLLDDVENATEEDVDLFLYLLNAKELTFDIKEIKKQSENFMVKNGISIEDAMEVVIKTLKLAFLPLKLIRNKEKTIISEKPVFDTVWLANVVAIVAKATNLPPEKIMRMPLNFCSHFMVEYARMNAINATIGRLAKEEALKKIDIRNCELVIDYLASKNFIKEDEKEKYFKIICNAEEKETE